MNQRINYLDSVRGLAAFSVLVYHVIMAHWGWNIGGKITIFFFNGGDAVSLFFVLSGLVLSLRHMNPGQPLSLNYANFVTARIFRLFPAFLVMLALYYGYVYWHDDYFFWNWATNKYFWLEEALLVRGRSVLLLPDWTLGVEVAISLLVPFFILIVRFNQKWLLYLMLVSFFVGKTYFNINIFHFCLGVWLAYHFADIHKFDFEKSLYYRFRYIIYLLIFLLYNIRHVVEFIPLNPKLQYILNLIGLDWFHVSGVAAGAILALCINRVKFQKILNWQPFLFLGKISYGIYLTHWLFINYLLMPRWDYFFKICGTENKMLVLFLFITISGSVLLSTLLYYFVEKPFINFGRLLIARKSFIKN